MATGWDRRFFASTRGQVVALLRRGKRTVEDLAQALGLTDNAVRSHLSALERDGLVRQSGLQRGPSRPAYAYELTPDSERLFPKPYGEVLAHLLTVLRDQLPPDQLEAALRDVGRRLAADHPTTTGSVDDRVERASQFLDELGGSTDVERVNGHFLIRGYGCPLSAATAVEPRACKLAESLLADLTGLDVSEQCEHGEAPCCRFEFRRVASSDGSRNGADGANPAE